MCCTMAQYKINKDYFELWLILLESKKNRVGNELNKV